MVLPYLFHGASVAMVPPWCFHGTSMILPWGLHGTSVPFRGAPVVFPSFGDSIVRSYSSFEKGTTSNVYIPVESELIASFNWIDHHVVHHLVPSH